MRVLASSKAAPFSAAPPCFNWGGFPCHVVCHVTLSIGLRRRRYAAGAYESRHRGFRQYSSAPAVISYFMPKSDFQFGIKWSVGRARADSTSSRNSNAA